MSGPQLLMETSMNYEQMANGEYHADSRFVPNVACNGDQIQIAEMEEIAEQTLNDVNEEQIVEDEVSMMKYQEADALIRDEMKKVILKKETEKVTVTVLSDRNTIITDKIKTIQVIRDEVEQGIEELNINLEVERDELQHLQKRLLYNGKIVEKLEGFMKTVDDAYKQKRFQSHQILREVDDQKKTVAKVKNWEKRIAQLKSNIGQKSSKGDARKVDNAKKENLQLKVKLSEKQEYLEKLKEQRQCIDSKKENLRHAMMEKEKLEYILGDRKEKVKDLKKLKNTYDDEIKVSTKELDLKTEQKRNKLASSLETTTNLKLELERLDGEYSGLQNELTSKQEYKTALEKKIQEISAKVLSRQEELQVGTDKWTKDIQNAKDQLKENENKLFIISKDNEELNCCLDNLKQQYISLVETKSEKLELRQALEVKLKADEMLLNKINSLDEGIAKKQNAVDELSTTLEKLTSDKSLQELEERNAYTIASTDYLNEKSENVLLQVETVRLELKTIKECIESNQKDLQEEEKLQESLLKELKDINNDTDLGETQRPPSSILKSPSSHKKCPISPKKVKFQGLSSESSSEQLVGSQPTSAKRPLDEILEEIQAAIFQTPAKVVKKRQVDIE